MGHLYQVIPLKPVIAGDYKETVVWTYQSRCTHELTEVLTAVTIPLQATAIYNSSMQNKGGDKFLPLVKELLAIDISWEKEKQYSLRMCPLMGG